MICCGTKIPNDQNPENILVNEIRQIDNMQAAMNLSNYKFEFQPRDGRWIENITNKDISEALNSRNIEELETVSEQLNKTLEGLEQNYLAKLAKLYIMIQSHCEIKKEIDDLFIKYGVSHKVIEREKIIEEEI